MNEIFLDILQNCWKYHDRIYILRKHCVIFIKEFYSILIYGYQGIANIYEKFKRYFNFLKVKVIIIIMVKDCKVYIKTKTLQYKSYRKLQILSISEWI